MNNRRRTALSLLGTPVTKKAQNAGKINPNNVVVTEGDGDNNNTTIVPEPEDDSTSTSFWDRYRGRDPEGNIIITPSGIGAGLAGAGALAGAALPGKDTPWWKRMIYSLLSAGVLGTAGYFGGKYLGSDPIGERGEEDYVPGGWNTGLGGKKEDTPASPATPSTNPPNASPEAPVPDNAN